MLAQRLRDDGRRERRRALLEGIIGHQLDGARLGLVGVDHRLGDLRDLHQHGFDLGQLDAIAADLDLGIDAAMELDLVLVVDAAEVAGAVDALRRVVGDVEEIGNELLLREVRPVEIPGGEPDAGDADLAQRAVVDGAILVLVENDDRIGRQRSADRHRLVRIQLGQRGRDRGLGRAIGVQYRAPGAMPAHHEIVRTGLAGYEQDPHIGQVPLDRRQQGGDAGEVGDVPVGEEIGEVPADEAGPRLARHQRGAGDERNPELLDREIEGDRHALIGAISLADAVHLGRDLHEIADAGVLDRDALGRAGRAGRVDDVAELVDRGGFFMIGQPRRGLAVDLAHGGIEVDVPDGEIGELRAKDRQRNDRLHLGVLQDEADALAGKAGVERDIGGVDLQHRQQRDVGIDGLVEHEADPVAGFQALLEQEPRHLVGAIVELAKGEDRVVGDDRLGARVAGGMQLVATLLEQVVEPLALFPANGVVGVLADQHGVSLRRAPTAFLYLDMDWAPTGECPKNAQVGRVADLRSALRLG